MNEYEIFLSKDDKVEALTIQRAVMHALEQRTSGEPLAMTGIEAAIAHARLSEENKDFGPLYAGQLVAKFASHPDDVRAAAALLRRGSRINIFGAILADHVQRNQGLKTQAKVFAQVSPFDGWRQASFYGNYINGIVDRVEAFARQNPPISDVPTILDVGTGNGFLIMQIVERLVQQGLAKKVRLVLNDQSQEMLTQATSLCESLKNIEEVVPLNCRIENLTGAEKAALQLKAPFWFILASASIHHMPKSDKVRMMQSLGDLSSHLLMGEFEGNNDLPEPNSPSLFYSVTQFYGPLFANVLASQATEEQKRATINDFLLAEAIIILRSEKRFGSAEELGRVDYHTSSNEWRDIAQRAGYATEEYAPLVLVKEGGRPVNYFMHFVRRAM